MSERTCSIDGCGKKHRGRGLCNAHLLRLQRHGDPLIGRITPQPRDGICSIEGCASAALSRGWCSTHYQRWQKHGDPLIALPKPTGEANWKWVGDAIGYSSMHDRVRGRRGKAVAYTCGCGARAAEWAYDHRDENERHDPELGLPYSLDPDHYVPMCKQCHRKFDSKAPERRLAAQGG